MCLYKLTHSGRLVNFNGVAVIPHSVFVLRMHSTFCIWLYFDDVLLQFLQQVADLVQ